MDAFLQSKVPWELKAAALFGVGLVLVIIILAIPKSVLAQTGQTKLLSPNAITIWRVLICWVGEWMFFRYSVSGGFLLVVFGSILDVTDGRTAVALRENFIPRSRMDRKVGEIIDPLADKLTILPFLALFAKLRIVNRWIVGPIIAIDVIGTLVREPVSLDHRIRSLLSSAKLVDTPSANRANAAGKGKTLFQQFGMIACVPIYLGWIMGSAVPNILLIIALILGCMSPLLRLPGMGELRRRMRRLDAFFTHRDF